ncbi:MAG TPA: peroxiredoxin [Deltaproteobacteria bacterium]|nr:peroxiredoxin [Deltaproteobacteria bacterium]HPJ94508.1 peroxiredoxin [Deltaproteobacteria bacterium]HPR51892.1 peroxiredoxin [Deltaproteobacteria bacterium]
MIQVATLCFVCILLMGQNASAVSQSMSSAVYDVGTLKPIDSILNVKVGEKAPDFTLNAVSGGVVSLSDYRGKQNVVISFVPAAWTPVCSDQWPGYNIAQELFKKNNAVLLGISVDNIPTLYAWTQQMGTLWFPVLSDFWPHGSVAKKFGVLRSNGTSERAIFIIDKKGIIRYIDVHNINKRPPLEEIIKELEKIR